MPANLSLTRCPKSGAEIPALSSAQKTEGTQHVDSQRSCPQCGCPSHIAAAVCRLVEGIVVSLDTRSRDYPRFHLIRNELQSLLDKNASEGELSRAVAEFLPELGTATASVPESASNCIATLIVIVIGVLLHSPGSYITLRDLNEAEKNEITLQALRDVRCPKKLERRAVRSQAQSATASERAPAPAPIRSAPLPGRNDPCPCGSGKKYKKCHGR